MQEVFSKKIYTSSVFLIFFLFYFVYLLFSPDSISISPLLKKDIEMEEKNRYNELNINRKECTSS